MYSENLIKNISEINIEIIELLLELKMNEKLSISFIDNASELFKKFEVAIDKEEKNKKKKELEIVEEMNDRFREAISNKDTKALKNVIDFANANNFKIVLNKMSNREWYPFVSAIYNNYPEIVKMMWIMPLKTKFYWI